MPLEGFNRRATARYHLGHFEESLEDISTVLEMEPRHFGALSGRGLVQAKQKDYTAACDSFAAALDVHPWYPGCLASLRHTKKKEAGQKAARAAQGAEKTSAADTAV